MIKQEQVLACVQIAKDYGATKVVLFGSTVNDPDNAHDIDLLCLGVPDHDFVPMHAEMENRAMVPVDVVTEPPHTPFTEIALKNGTLLYERH